MSRTGIFAIYIVVDLLIVVGVLWAVFQTHWPASKLLLLAAALFVLNGLWLVAMTIKKTPPGGSQ